MANIIVPAFSIKWLTRSQTWVNTFFAAGMRYAGSSIMKEASLSVNRVFLKRYPDSMPTTMPNTYRLSITSMRPFAKNAPAIRPYTGSLAEQLIKGSSSMVMRLSLSFSMVRAPIVAGTVQPKPISSGIKLFPERPNFRMGLSIMKAMRLI